LAQPAHHAWVDLSKLLTQDRIRLADTSPATRIVAFGGAAVQIEYTRGRAADLVEFLFRRIPDTTDGPVAPDPVVVSERHSDGVFTVSYQGEVCAVDRREAVIASWVLHVTCLRLARGSVTGLMLHAGGVSWAGRGLLIPGASGSGKSTTTSFLTDRGFEYLTDELVHVPSDSTVVEGLAVPLKIKNHGLAALTGHVSLARGTSSSLEGAYEVLVSPDRFACAAAAVPLSLIIFPRYTPRGRFRLELLSSSQAGLRLMAGILNGGALPDHGFREAVRLARLAPAYEMRYANLGQVAKHLALLQRMTTSSGRPRVNQDTLA